jgi:hypothetical protein
VIVVFGLLNNDLLEDKRRSGSKPKYGIPTGRRTLALLDRLPPSGYGRDWGC